MNVVQHAAETIDLGPALSLRGARMRFQRNGEIFGESETADYIYCVVSGAVRSLRFTSDGRRQILGFHLPGEVFGVELGAQHTLTCEALSATEVVMAPRSLLEQAIETDPEAARCWLNHAARALNDAREHALLLGRKGAGERVAAFLLGLSARLLKGHDFDLPMSRADIADYLGLTIETVSRSFTEMERKRAIWLPSSRRVVLRDRSSLALAAAA
jgi:CRP/FNR family nitrogen fixation transcriptional regulator